MMVRKQAHCTMLSLIAGLILMSVMSMAAAAQPRSEKGQDAFQPIAAMLTRSVLITRENAGVEKAEIESHIDDLRDMFAQFVAQASDSLPEPYADDIHLHGYLGEMLSTIDIARVFFNEGNIHSAHHAFKGLRLQVGELRSRNGVVVLGDMVWRYNCAFHPIMHVIMHQPAGKQLTEGQLDVFAGTVENAELALAAVEAIVNHTRYNTDSKLKHLFTMCKESLEHLSEILEKRQTDKVVQSTREMGKHFIALALYECRGHHKKRN